jgi:hypothetical protein
VSGPNTNPLSYNDFIQQISAMAVVLAEEVAGVWQFVDVPMQTITEQILNYSELRIQRDLDLLPSQTSNNYPLTAGNNLLQIDADDFFTIQTLEVLTLANATVVNSTPLMPVSKEFIQNCYGGLSSAGTPQYFAMYGDNFNSPGQDTNTNILLGPPPNFPYTVRITGTVKMPSLFNYNAAGAADTQYTYISAYYPDMLIIASMIFVSAFQRNFSATSADTEMSMSYEKQYQVLRLGAVEDEDTKSQHGSAWTGYTTPTAATPTR